MPNKPKDLICQTDSKIDVVDKVVNGKTIYGPVRTARLARRDSSAAAYNADNYRWFANVMYLNNNDWSRTIAARIAAVDAANAKRSANLTRMNAHGYDGLGHRTLLTNRCPEVFEDDQDLEDVD